MTAGTDFYSGSPVLIDHMHHRVHEGLMYSVLYSVASIGALTTPDDVISLSFKTPNTAKRLHMYFEAVCTGGARIRMIRGKTGGGATPAGVLPAYNHDEESTNTSLILDVAGANVGNVSYNATVFTGGVTLIDEFLTGVGVGASSPSSGTASSHEVILARDTEYQISILDTGTIPATLELIWYEAIPNLTE